MGIVKEVLNFTGVMWLFGQVLGLLGLITNYWIAVWLGAAAAFKGILSLGNSLSNLATGFGPSISTSMSGVSEAYNNKKPELAKYYLQNDLKYAGFVGFARVVPLLIS